MYNSTELATRLGGGRRVVDVQWTGPGAGWEFDIGKCSEEH